MTPLVVGVDGGGSHTRAMVASLSGEQLALAEGPGSAVKPGAEVHSADVIASVVSDAVHAVDVAGAFVRVLCVGVAGTGRETEREALLRELESRDIARDVIVMTDAEIALEDAFGAGAGVILIAGTGSIAFGRGPTGSVSRAGGWGPVCGDEGSGAWIGRHALGIVTSAHDGREPETALTPALLTAAGVESVEALVPWAAAAGPALLATLAPAVQLAAKAGDLRANSLLTLAVEELALHARTLARGLFMDERAAVTVAFGGGLLTKGTLCRKRLEARLRTMVPGATVRADEIVPVRGAVKHAVRNADRVSAVT